MDNLALLKGVEFQCDMMSLGENSADSLSEAV
jgi:hypothetical protein